MEIYTPKVFDPAETIFQESDGEPDGELDETSWDILAKAPSFLGNYSEVDSLEMPEDEPHPALQAMALEVVRTLQSIDIGSLKKSTENEHVLDDLIEDVRRNAFLILEHQRFTALADLLRQNGHVQDI